MVHVIFAKVVFGKIGDVGLLDVRYVRRSQNANVHYVDGLGSIAEVARLSS